MFALGVKCGLQFRHATGKMINKILKRLSKFLADIVYYSLADRESCIYREFPQRLLVFNQKCYCQKRKFGIAFGVISE